MSNHVELCTALLWTKDPLYTPQHLSKWAHTSISSRKKRMSGFRFCPIVAHALEGQGGGQNKPKGHAVECLLWRGLLLSLARFRCSDTEMFLKCPRETLWTIETTKNSDLVDTEA